MIRYLFLPSPQDQRSRKLDFLYYNPNWIPYLKVTRYTYKEQVKKSQNFYSIYRILTKTSIQEENIQLIKNQW